jgi:hypothetical protein
MPTAVLSLNKVFQTFVSWIDPEKATEKVVSDQAEEIRSRIKSKAEEDGLIIKSTPISGSFAKDTGLRRHFRGDHEIDGQDVDITFVVAPKNADDEKITTLLDKFARYANASYPDTERKPTKSSINLIFSTGISYDLVPLLATNDPQRQILLRADGERRETSVQGHVNFVKNRTIASLKTPGKVPFNECLRLMKWWRDIQQANSQVLKEVPSFLIDLLCAKAFDALGTTSNYHETLARWFGYLANTVSNRKMVYFPDFISNQPSQSNDKWRVLDPVNFENNVVSGWPNYDIDEFSSWFAEARDRMAEAMVTDQHQDETAMMEPLIGLFGNAIKSHGGK